MLDAKCCAIRVVTAVVLFAAVISFCHANEKTRRFSVELEVFAANAAQLVDSHKPPRYIQGLKLRMASTLGYLKFLAREYLVTKPHADTQLLNEIDALRQVFAHGDWHKLAKLSRRLAILYPMKLGRLNPDFAGMNDIRAGEHIYTHLCMGCHEHPAPSAAVPAENLYTMVRSEPVREYVARLIAGVHGTPAVALRNPFSDKEIAGLAAYLRRGQKKQ